MGSIERVDRPKPWRARYRSPDGRKISKSFRRKADAEKWLLLEEGDVLAGRWHDPQSGTELFSDYCEKWMEERSPTVARPASSGPDSQRATGPNHPPPPPERRCRRGTW